MEFEWGKLLIEWNEAVFHSPLADQLPSAVREQGWLGRPGATMDQLQKLENRLQVTLPPSYKSFLQFSNGWYWVSVGRLYRIWSVEEVDWFSVRNQDWIDAWEEDPNLGPISDELLNELLEEPKYMRNSLEVSELGDSEILLLNVKKCGEDGECDAGSLANWYPGISDYGSFWNLMQHEYKVTLETIKRLKQRGK
jgi:hypothetical protein